MITDSILADSMLVDSMIPIEPYTDITERYRLGMIIGCGATATVYEAFDLALSSNAHEARLAVKVFRSGHPDEARLARRIDHPNVVRILDRGEYDRFTYVVMEYVEGPEFKEIVASWTIRDKVLAAHAIAEGIHAAHEAGIIHCDLKPDNILLTKGGTPKIADFGIAATTEEGRTDHLGNLAFIAPERLRDPDAPITTRCDIFAVGGILSHMLTGRYPQGDRADEIRRRAEHFQPAEPVRVEHDLDAIVARAVASDPASRYASADALAQDLMLWLRGECINWTRPSTTRRLRLWVRRHPAMGAVAGLFIVLFFFATIAASTVELAILRETEQRMEAQRQRLGTVLEQAIGMTLSLDRSQEILPVLLFIKELHSLTLLTEAGTLADLEVRMFEAIEQTSRDGPSDDDLATGLARYQLAFVQIQRENYDEARAQLDAIHGSWYDHLDGDDPIQVTLIAMRTCLDAWDGTITLDDLVDHETTIWHDHRYRHARELCATMVTRIRSTQSSASNGNAARRVTAPNDNG